MERARNAKGLGTKYFFGDEPCDVCQGARLRPESLNVFLGKVKEPANHDGPAEGMNIVHLASLSIEDAMEFFNKLKLSRKRAGHFQSRHQRNHVAPAIHAQRGHRISHARSQGQHALRRGSAAHSLASQLGSGLWARSMCSTSRRSASISATTTNSSRR
jgi:hypothetical protein